MKHPSLVRLAAALVLAGCYQIIPAASDDGGAAAPGGAGKGGSKGGSGAAAGSGSGTSGHGGHAGSKAQGGTGGSSGATAGAGSAADGGSSSSRQDAGTDASEPFVLSTDPGLRVALLGDQAINANADAVLRLVKSEGADMVIHAGDFDYVENVDGWHAQIDGILGPDFPYFASIGNHDVYSWPGPDGYQAGLLARLARIPGATCTGDLGVNSVCRYRGLMFVLSGVGTYGDGTEAYLENAIAAPDVWRLCVWHKNQHDMQVGGKVDEVGWRAYQICQTHGAPIVTAHEHSYGRTHTLTALGDAASHHGFIGQAEQLFIGTGSTVVFQSGLGGHSYRRWNGDYAPWWATIYASNKQVMNDVEIGVAAVIEYGALFIDFHVDEDPYLARGYFKTTGGKVVDEFSIRVVP